MDRIPIPNKLQIYVMNWYHKFILNHVLNITEAMIHQSLYQTVIIESTEKGVTNCDMLQRTKQSTQNSKLTAKLVDKIPWNKICVDIIGSYRINRKGKQPLIPKPITNIDTVTEWFEVT